MLKNVFSLIILLFLTTGCSLFQKSMQKSNRQQNKMGSPTSEANSDMDAENNNTAELRRLILDLERKLENKKEKEQYSKALPWFKNDKERFDYLNSKGLEAKTQFLQQRKILQRQQIPPQELRDIVENQDIAIGMPMDFVLRSWGEPTSKEVSGNPLYKNEKWRYLRNISSPEGFRQERRIVYFEGGKVVGWESE